jgi:hypothetical protein
MQQTDAARRNFNAERPWGASEFIAHAGYVGVIAFPYAPKYAIRAGPVMQAVDKLPLGVIDESKGDFRSQI